ncbi:MAG: hypothetical protein HY059_07420 [Proteobacteria bacterium]|nr:hypothetical protein [Pseudomonadota bacterium]
MLLDFDVVLGGFHDLDLYGLPAERALELPDALLRGPERASRRDIAVPGDRRLADLREEILPALYQRPRHAELSAQFRRGDLATQDTLYMLAHGIMLYCRCPGSFAAVRIHHDDESAPQ